MSNPPIELTVWEGDYGLSSMSPECIYIMLYMKLTKVPVKLKFKKNPYWNVGEDFPIFQHGRLFTTNIRLIMGYLRMKRYSTEFGLSSKQCSQSYAFSIMLEKTLKPIVEFVWWVDRKNYDCFAKKWYVRVMPFPVNFFYPSYRRRKAKDLIKSLFNSEDYDRLEAVMVNAAEKCFTTLRLRLGKCEYFYGNSPTSLDAMVYGYLAPLIKLPFPSSKIPKLLKKYTELVDFVKRIDSEFHADLTNECKYLKPSSEDELELVPLSFKEKMFTCILVTFIMILYAFKIGLIYL